MASKVMEFSRNDDGNYQASLDNITVTVKTYLDKTYVDVREYFRATGSLQDKPARRGITLTKEEWNAVTNESRLNKTYEDFKKVYSQIAAHSMRYKPDSEQITPLLIQSMDVCKHYANIVFTKARQRNSTVVESVPFSLSCWYWYRIFRTNREKINDLITLLENETSVAVGQDRTATQGASTNL